MKKIPSFLIVLSIIFLVGFCLRAYRFHDWLRFNGDQARDAALISGVIEGKWSLPLLGPRAGGTEFKLGPAFYYMEYLSAKIFGNYPDKMAYPDLFFSILSIPLLFFLLRKYFNDKISLSLASIYAVSFFAIRYSRFAWNPNSTPFYSMFFMYSLLEIFRNSDKKKKILFSVLAGVAIGIGSQLHTFLLFGLPAILVIFFAIYWKKNPEALRNIAIIFIVALVLNVPQIISEFKTKGENIKQLFLGTALVEQKSSKTLFQKVTNDAACYSVANMYILSFLGDSDNCKIYNKKVPLPLAHAGSAMAFTFGGLILLIHYLRQEIDPNKKRFLVIFLIHIATIFLLMIPVASEISMRYFLILIFMPFIFLGLWAKFIQEKLKIYGFSLIAILLVFLLAINLYFIRKNFAMWRDVTEKTGGNFNNVYLGEMELIASYIVENSQNAKNIYITGNKDYLQTAFRSISYLIGLKGVKANIFDSTKMEVDTSFFLANARSKDIEVAKNKMQSKNYKVEVIESFGRFAIIKFVIMR